MKKTYTIVIVLILVVLGVLFFTGKGSKLEAPAVINDVSKESEETGLVSEEETTIAEVREFTISGQNFSFTPSSIMVKKGDKVKITLKNIDGFHDFKIDEYGVATKQLLFSRYSSSHGNVWHPKGRIKYLSRTKFLIMCYNDKH